MSTDERDMLINGPMDAGPVRRGDVPRPGTALVFTLDDGEPVVLQRRPSLREAPRYTYRYEVDTTDHFTNWKDELPSSTTGFAFPVAIRTGWRVSAPEAVVRRSIGTVVDGARLVRGAISEALRTKLRRFDIEDAAAAEESVNHFLRSRERVLDSGITVFACSLEIGLEPKAGEVLRGRREAEWGTEVEKRDYGKQVLRTTHEAKVTELRANALREAARGEGGLLLHLIAQQPSELRSILQEVAERQDIALDRKRHILQDFVANDLLHPAEVADLMQKLIDQPLPFGSNPTAPNAASQHTTSALPGGLGRQPTQAGAAPLPDDLYQADQPHWPDEEPGTAPAAEPTAGGGDGVVGWRTVSSGGNQPAAPEGDEDA